MPTPPTEYNATLVDRQDITPRLSIFRVRHDDPAFEFVAGQYTVLGLKYREPRIETAAAVDEDGKDPEKLIRRPYSICSGTQQQELEFYISMLTAGELTPRLWCLHPGSRLFVGPMARGFLTLEEVPSDTNLLLVATGTGLGPYISMLRSYARDFPAQRVGVIHGASYSWDLGYRPELEGYAREFPNLIYLPTISRPEEDPQWSGASGRVQSWLEAPGFAQRFGFELEPRACHVFLCGNPGMIEAATGLLTARDFREQTRKEPGTLHAEKYW